MVGSQPHDYIKHSVKSKTSRIAEFRAFYEQGLSLRQIQERTGVSKTKISQVLQKAGITIRDFSRSQKKKYDLTQVVRSGAIPYGYTYLEGKLVVDPREYKVIHEMYRMWQSGKSLRAIARALNDRQVPTRFGKSWKHEVIKKVIERHEHDQKMVKGGKSGNQKTR